MSLLKLVVWSSVVVTLSACGGQQPTSPTTAEQPVRPASGMTFTTPNLGGISAGAANAGYSFCRPPISGNDLCGASSTNPTGGTPPYTFQLGTAGGFPPIGMTLNLNGTLTGTPTAAGRSNFVVCAVDLTRTSKCDTVEFIVDPRSEPAPPPAPTGSAYAGTYDFSYVSPGGPQSLSQYWFVNSNAQVGSTDRLVSGTVDGSGNVRFTAPCWTSSGGTATWIGTLSATTPKSGGGTFTCASNGINGGTWRVVNGR